MGLSNARLLRFARDLQHASSYGELLAVIAAEAKEALGYGATWLFVAEKEDAEELCMLDASSAIREDVLKYAVRLKVKGDAMLEEIIRSDLPVVVVDARTDPRTDKKIVEALQNRTIINVPLRLLDKPFGAFGIGTFGDEGVREPSPEELDYLVGMGNQVAVAASRIRFLEERANAAAEKSDLERRILQMQRLESLGMLAGGVAHDFNNLLTVILSTAGLMASTTEDEQLREDAAAIAATAERGRGLTRQLLAMSKTQALAMQEVDLAPLVRELVTLVRRVIPATIDIDVICADALPTIEADRVQLEQVLMNLCINARDAMPKGGRLTIELEQVLVNGSYVKAHPWAKPGRYVLLTVTDTGIGMPREVLDHVFEPFFTTKKDSGGSGLGLAVAYGIVTQHGGMVNVYSEVGLGTTFKVYLPVLARSASHIGTKIEGAVIGGTERILVAEDDAGVRAVIERVLMRAGYDVVVVGDGAAACEEASKTAFGLVILDVIMPTMSGPDALERIQKLDSHAQARFILSSGYVGETSAHALVSEGRATLLEKPYDPDELLRTVRRVLDG